MSRSFLAPLVFSCWRLPAASAPEPASSAKNEPVISGRLEFAGPTFGTQSFEPKACASGEHEVFLGADFSSPGSRVVARIAVDPLEGPGARIFDKEARFEKALVLRRETCQNFHFALDRSGWRINDVYVLKVHLELDCSLPNGDTVKGSLDAASCF